MEGFNRPGGNVTGVTTINAELGGKWLSLVGDLVRRVFQGSREQLLLNVLKRRRLTANERALLRDILEEHDS